MGTSLSAVVITRNEEANIERCLKSVSWVDEIIVVDSQSVDRTPDIARQFTEHVYSRTFEDYSSQKNYALSLAKSDWVISIDADEEVSPELRNEIGTILKSNPEAEAYAVRRRSRIFGRFFNFTGTQDDSPVRLFKRGAGIFEQPIHEVIKIQGLVLKLKAPLYHYTYNSVSEYMRRLNRYTSMEASYFCKKKKSISFVLLVMAGPATFLRRYFLLQGFRDGFQGYVFSLLSGYYAFVKHSKYHVLNHSR